LEIGIEQLRKTVDAVEDKKGRDIAILDIKEISSITDYFLIVTGNTTIQTKAIAEHLDEKLGEIGIPVLRIEGLREASWVLIDCGDLVIHIMTPEARAFYSLERLWGDAKEVNL